MNDTSPSENRITGSEIAIVGLHCRVPGASTPERFWENLRNGVDAVVFASAAELRAEGVPESLIVDPRFVRAIRRCEDAESADAAFFGLTPREAQLTDPQVRVFLETAWEVFERAGYDPQTYPGLVGVYAGMGTNTYVAALLADDRLSGFANKATIRVANDRGALATSTAYKLNLKGPCLTIQTACSTSLVAVHLGCQALLEGECDMALAGGVAIESPAAGGYLYEEGGILSPDGRCRAFDAQARGTAGGSGAGVVLLKRLADALADGDRIHAVIKGSAINNDGAGKVGYTAPSVGGQSAVIRSALTVAGVEADSISFVEAHGTGTPLGDPVEVAALSQAFRGSTRPRPFCAIGSVKSNVGHLDAAAGITSLIKAVLAIEHREIPASLHYETQNPRIELQGSPFYVNAALRPWTGPRPLRAGVSSFGIGGTNAHVILEEAPAASVSTSVSTMTKADGPHLLVMSARTPATLVATAANLARHLRTQPDVSLADTAYTLQVGRKAFGHRSMLVCEDRGEAVAALEALDPERCGVAATGDAPPVVLLFPGQGAQFAGMGRDLYEAEPRFRQVIDRCCDTLRPALGFDLREILYPEGDAVDRARRAQQDTAIVQPALFVTAYALATLWRAWGVSPAAMIGHSLGEYVAACLAGVFTERDALDIVATRGALMQQTMTGAMLALEAREEEIAPLLPADVSVAAFNSPRQCVVSGPERAIAEFASELNARSIVYRRLRGSRAFHSSSMDPILAPLLEKLRGMRLQAPRLRFISNVSGRWITGDEATDPAYWVKQARHPVRFAAGLDAIDRHLPGCVWLECGPGSTLGGLVRQNLAGRTTLSPMASQAQPPSPGSVQTRGSGVAPYLDTLGRLWLSGVEIDWRRHHAHEKRRRVTLPTYPFERRRYHASAASSAHVRDARADASVKRDLAEWFYVPGWKQTPAIGASPGNARARWLAFAQSDEPGQRLVQRLIGCGASTVAVVPGETYARMDADTYRIRPGHDEDYLGLLAALAAQEQLPDRIVHAWDLAPASSLQSHADAWFQSVLSVVRAWTLYANGAPCAIDVVSTGLHAVTGQEDVDPRKAAVLGLCAVVPREHPEIRCRVIDVWTSTPARDANGDIDRLVDELMNEAGDTGASNDTVIALRGRRRWTRTFERVSIAHHAGSPARLRTHGVYLITGGPGRVGLALASYLARASRARLVLVSRSPFPVESDWDGWLAERGDSDESRTIARVRALRDAGADVLILRADVSDAAQMRTVVADTHDRFGPITGVIHAAGHVTRAGFESLDALTTATCAAQFAPKRDGVLVLEDVLCGEPLDFCVLCSSLSSVLGGVGHGAYAAANAVMDAFAQQREPDAAGALVWTSINWDGWDFGAADERTGDAYALAMTPEEGVEAFARILSLDRPASQILVSTADLDARLAGARETNINRRSHDLAAAASTSTLTVGRDTADTAATVATGPARPRPREPEHWIADDYDRIVCDVWEQALGVKPVADANFFQVGGNSLSAIKVVSELRKRLRRDISLETVFTYATARQLATRIRQQASASEAKSAEPGRDEGPGALAVSGAVDASTHADVSAGRPPLVPELRPTPLPVSYAQQRLWFIDRLQGGSTEYHLLEALRIRGPLDRDALARTIDAIVARHESLRTHFAEIDGTPVQIVAPAVRIALPVDDLRDLDERAQQDRIQHALRRERDAPFDLTRGPLIRMRLLQLGDDDCVVLRTMHHIGSDAWSEGVFNRELTELYAAHRAGRADPFTPLAVQYADFALWQRRWLEGGALDEGVAYWTRQLSGAPERLALPMDRPRPPAQTFVADKHQAVLPAARTDALKRVAQTHQATLYMASLAAFAVLLSRYSGQQDIVIGSPIANRQDAATEALIGFFVNSLVLRLAVRPDACMADVLREARRTALEAYRYQDVPFERVVEALAPPRSLNVPPLFQVTLALQNTPWTSPRLDGASVELAPGDELRVSVDLEVYAIEQDGQLACTWLYNRDLFDRWRIEQMARHYARVLDAMAADASAQTSEIALLDEAERHQVLHAWNRTDSPVPPLTVSVLFEAAAARQPDAIAVECEDASLSYAALNARADRLAHALIARGVGPDDPVGIALDRSIDLVVAILGVLKAGGVCLPLDRAHPPARVAAIVAEARPVCMLERVDAMTALIASAASSHDVERRPPVRLDHLAYAIYTSGSTGRPKGVVVSHRALTNKVWTLNEFLRVTRDTRSAVTSPVAFDPLFEELLCPLVAGGVAVMLSDRVRDDAAELARAIRRHRISIVDGTPALAEQLIDATPAIPPLDVLTIGGDVLPARLARALRASGSARRVLNMYGPAEACIDASAHEIGDEVADDIATVPIGGPLPNYRLYVLDGRLHPAPIGVAGELFIGGAGLARGYLRQAALTAARFIADPYGAAGARLYRTGDVARRRPDGRLEFIGRTDDQIKIHGVRVEPGDVEHALRRCDGVRQAAAIVDGGAGDTRTGHARMGDGRLIAYVSAASGHSLDPRQVRRHVEQHLPASFVPALVIVLDDMPMTPHGKVDRRMLPRPDERTGDVCRPPVMPDEDVLCAVFAEVLDVPRVGLDDDFFALGGHSLLAMRVVSRIRAALGVELPIRALFEAPTIGELCARLREGARVRPPLTPQVRPSPLPASYAQQRLWFIDRLEGGSTAYHLPEALRLRGPLDRVAMTRAIDAIVARHESLRTHFAEVDGTPVQIVEPRIAIDLPIDDLRGLDEQAQRERIQDALRHEWAAPFDLTRGPLLRARLLRLGADDHVLVRTLHHIVSDGWSQGVFDRELMALYDAFRDGRENPLPLLPVQYADAALWQRRWLESGALDEGVAYWKEQLSGIPGRITLPTDRPRPPRLTFAASRHQLLLPPDESAALAHVSRRHHATLYMTLLAALGVLLARYTGQEDIVVGTAAANRPDTAAEPLIGFFVNALVLRLRVRPALRFVDLLEQVRKTTLDAYRHQDVPFERVVEALAPRRSLNAPPLFQIGFAMQHAPGVSPRLAGLTATPIAADDMRVRVDLEIHAFEHEEQIGFAWVYNTALFDRWRIEQASRHYVRVLRTILDTPDVPLHRVSLMDEDDLRTVLERFNATA